MQYYHIFITASKYKCLSSLSSSLRRLYRGYTQIQMTTQMFINMCVCMYRFRNSQLLCDNRQPFGLEEASVASAVSTEEIATVLHFYRTCNVFYLSVEDVFEHQKYCQGNNQKRRSKRMYKIWNHVQYVLYFICRYMFFFLFAFISFSL